MTETEPGAAKAPDEPPAGATSEASGAADEDAISAQAINLARESMALVEAMARLAATEASLSALAIERTLWSAVLTMAASVLAVGFLAAAAVTGLARLLDSTELALALVGLALVGLAWWARANTARWRSRIGFAETRAALSNLAAGGKPKG